MADATGTPQNMSCMYENMKAMMKKLKKPEYEKRFGDFRDQHGELIRQIVSRVDQAEDKKSAAEATGRQLVQELKEKYAMPRGKMNSGVQADLNLFTIFYVFPAILMEGGDSAKQAADGICEEWAKEFKGNNIQYTDYDTLYGSFRNKIFGLF